MSEKGRSRSRHAPRSAPHPPTRLVPLLHRSRAARLATALFRSDLASPFSASRSLSEMKTRISRTRAAAAADRGTFRVASNSRVHGSERSLCAQRTFPATAPQPSLVEKRCFACKGSFLRVNATQHSGRLRPGPSIEEGCFACKGSFLRVNGTIQNRLRQNQAMGLGSKRAGELVRGSAIRRAVLSLWRRPPVGNQAHF